MNWINIRERLPESGNTVLIVTPDGPEDVWIGYHDGVWRQIDGCPVEGRVTHWGDFPEPPIITNGNGLATNAHLEAPRNGV